MIKLREVLNSSRLEGRDRTAVYKPRVIVDCERTFKDNPTVDRTFGYCLEAKLYVEFWANNAQYSDARKHAEKTLLQQVYREVLHELEHTRSCLYAQDIPAALNVIDKLQTELMTP